jgi:glycosyltransferase involved in cell wall biosynthesis
MKEALKTAPSVSFVMPMFNERENIAGTISKLKSVADDLTSDYELVVVDDGSSDGSADIVDTLAKNDRRIRSFRLDKNTMFGGAFAECFRRASKDVIMYMDSDMPVGIEDIKASFPFIQEADIVTGYSKVKKGDTMRRKFMSLVYNLMVRALFGLNVRDVNSGFKIVRKKLIEDIKFISKSPFIDVELFIHARKKKAKVYQYPLVFNPRAGGKSYIARVPVIMATFRDMIKVRILS